MNKRLIIVTPFSCKQIFAPIHRAFVQAFQKLGLEVVSFFPQSLMECSFGNFDTIFLIGGHEFGYNEFIELKKTNKILMYLTEHISVIGSNHLDDYLHKISLCDGIYVFSEQVMHCLRSSCDSHNFKYLPFGWEKINDRFVEKPLYLYDCTFIGTPSPRRSQIIEHCRGNFISGCYDREFMYTVIKSKVNLNLHFYNIGNEHIRCVLILSTGGFLLTESGVELPNLEKGLDYDVADGYNEIGEKLMSYLGEPEKIEAMRKSGYEKLKGKCTLVDNIIASGIIEDIQ